MGTHPLEEAESVFGAYADRLEKAVTRITQKAALAAGDYLARETPVDTGVARSNWVMTVDEGFRGILPAYVPYPSYRPNHHEQVKQAAISTTPARVRVFKAAPFRISAGAIAAEHAAEVSSLETQAFVHVWKTKGRGL